MLAQRLLSSIGTCLCCAVLFGMASISPSISRGAEVEQPDVQLGEVNKAISAIESWINDAANNRSQLENDLRTVNVQIEALRQSIDSNQLAVLSSQTELDVLQKRSTELEQQKTAQQELVAQALRASYMIGRDSSLKLLLNQEDPGPGARMLRYYAAFNASRLTQLAAYQQTLNELSVTTAEIADTTSSLQERSAELEQQLVSLTRSRESRAKILLALEVELASRSNQLEQLVQDRQHLENLITEINRIVSDIPAPEELMPFAQAQGELPWPLAGSLLNSFGASYSEGNLQRQGIIISAAEGTAVRAIHPGRVVFADWLRGSGFLVVLDHGQGYMSLYAHNQGLLKQSGDWANRGEAIAAAGNNAGMDSPGIYFEIRHNGQAQNPVNWCVTR